MGFPRGSAGKNLPAEQELQETWVQSLGREDPREEGMASHSSSRLQPGESSRTKKPGRLQSIGLQILGHDEGT